MIMKIVAAVLAFALFAIYNGVIAIKLKDAALSIVILIGFVMMAVDLVQSLKNKDD
jgi:ABC-type branched-subunit amino acid transport system permease subunit